MNNARETDLKIERLFHGWRGCEVSEPTSSKNKVSCSRQFTAHQIMRPRIPIHFTFVPGECTLLVNLNYMYVIIHTCTKPVLYSDNFEFICNLNYRAMDALLKTHVLVAEHCYQVMNKHLEWMRKRYENPAVSLKVVPRWESGS